MFGYRLLRDDSKVGNAIDVEVGRTKADMSFPLRRFPFLWPFLVFTDQSGYRLAKSMKPILSMNRLFCGLHNCSTPCPKRIVRPLRFLVNPNTIWISSDGSVGLRFSEAQRLFSPEGLKVTRSLGLLVHWCLSRGRVDERNLSARSKAVVTRSKPPRAVDSLDQISIISRATRMLGYIRALPFRMTFYWRSADDMIICDGEAYFIRLRIRLIAENAAFISGEMRQGRLLLSTGRLATKGWFSARIQRGDRIPCAQTVMVSAVTKKPEDFLGFLNLARASFFTARRPFLLLRRWKIRSPCPRTDHARQGGVAYGTFKLRCGGSDPAGRSIDS